RADGAPRGAPDRPAPDRRRPPRDLRRVLRRPRARSGVAIALGQPPVYRRRRDGRGRRAGVRPRPRRGHDPAIPLGLTAAPARRLLIADPLVSVIVPVRNGERFLAEALASVVAQRYRPLELIVVDDGSSDGSGAIARGVPEVVCLFQDAQGVSVARNAGLGRA